MQVRPSRYGGPAATGNATVTTARQECANPFRGISVAVCRRYTGWRPLQPPDRRPPHASSPPAARPSCDRSSRRVVCGSRRRRLDVARRRAAVRVGREQRRDVLERLRRALQPRLVIGRPDRLDSAVRIGRRALPGRRLRSPARSRPGMRTWCSSHRVVPTDLPCRRRMRPGRRTSRRRAARWRSSTARLRSRAVRPQARVRVPRRLPTWSGTAVRRTTKEARRPPRPTRRLRSPAGPEGAPTPTRTPTTSQPSRLRRSTRPQPARRARAEAARRLSRRARLSACRSSPSISIALGQPSLDFGALAAGATAPLVSEGVTVTSNDSAGYTLTAHRSAFAPRDLPLGLAAAAPAGGTLATGISPTVLAALPIAPAPDLAIGSTSAAAAAGGDVWATKIGFTTPLPSVPAGQYTATVTVHAGAALTVRALVFGLAVVLATGAPASAGAPRRAGLVVWPARTTLDAGTVGTLHIANHTRAAVALSVKAVGLALDLRGAPRLVRSSAGTALIAVRSSRVVVAAGRSRLGRRPRERNSRPRTGRPSCSCAADRTQRGRRRDRRTGADRCPGRGARPGGGPAPARARRGCTFAGGASSCW